ncbi:retinol dehydrogenase 11-like [Sarcoptes scabiei]|nr:retinol dehydrogenase 11-like [Sarcoptes scabiei]
MLTRLALILLLLVLLLSVLIAIFFNLINTDGDYNHTFQVNRNKILNDHILIDDKNTNIFWFIHLSDTHFSCFREKNRKSDLINYCKNILPIINPSVLILTGDITDARSRYPLGSDQYHQEWLMYREVMAECLKYNPKMKWLDIRGNHDSFNSYNDYNNFLNYTIQSNLSSDGKSYRYEIKSDDGNRYSFIGADACLYPGVRRPFNFVGQFDQNELNKLIRFKEESVGSNYTIWYGHYPTSSIFNKENFRSIINGPYLCGHYHTIHGLVTSMISTQPQGFLEAETGDWKDYRAFRIAAIDHGLFTFANYRYRSHHDLPLIVITNPRSILHQMEHLEPFWRTASSTHIRALIFSKETIIEAKAFITKEPKFNHQKIIEEFYLRNNSRQYLWTSKWSSRNYSNGLFYLTVIASNKFYSNQITVPFSLDRTRPSYSFWGRLLLRIDFRTIVSVQNFLYI